MRTHSQARRLRQQQLHKQQVPLNLVELPIVTMADNRTMAELLQAPTEGYEDAIVVPEIEAANFEIKHGLLTLLMLFPFSLEGAARIWLEKEPPRSIQTWEQARADIGQWGRTLKISENSCSPGDALIRVFRIDHLDTFYLPKLKSSGINFSTERTKPQASARKSGLTSCVTCGEVIILIKNCQTLIATYTMDNIQEYVSQRLGQYPHEIVKTISIEEGIYLQSKQRKQFQPSVRNMPNTKVKPAIQMANLTDCFQKFVTPNTASTSVSWTLSWVTMLQPKGKILKAITTRLVLPSKTKAVNPLIAREISIPAASWMLILNQTPAYLLFTGDVSWKTSHALIEVYEGGD
ncbi:hypothetical protein Tco_0863180 [Tanacetum coccineum]